jgi:hypothetical protein
VHVRFVSQPFHGGTDLRDFLQAVAAQPGIRTLRMVVAWAKRSGLARAADELNAIRASGGMVIAIVGVSEGGATEQGLRMLIEHTDEAYVFHDRKRTFHPKVYLAESGDHAMLLAGSHNLTAGGLAWTMRPVCGSTWISRWTPTGGSTTTRSTTSTNCAPTLMCARGSTRRRCKPCWPTAR